MFNKDLKQEYISYKESITNCPKGYLNNLFERSSVYESNLNKDVCSFTVKEILELYAILNFNSYDTLNVINSHYRLYTEYCLLKGLVHDNQNHYNEIQKKQLMDCINPLSKENKIITKEKLVNYCNTLVNYGDKFIIRCLFEGICGKELRDIFLAKISDIDINKKKMTLSSGRIVNVSSTLIDYAIEADNAKEQYPNVDSDTLVWKSKEYIPSDKIVKWTKRSDRNYDDNNIVMYRNKVSLIFKFLGLTHIVTPNSIIESGIIDTINEYCKNHNMVAAEAVYKKDLYNYIYEQFNKKIVRSTFIDKYQKFLVS